MALRAPRLCDYGIASGWAGLYEVDARTTTGCSGRRIQPDDSCTRQGSPGHGFLMAPAVGEVIRDLYLRPHARVDVSPLDADRFSANRTRPELNIV